MGKPIEVHVEEDGAHCSCTLTQGAGKDKCIIAMASREWQKQETSASRMERLLLASLWGIKRYARYTLFCTQLTLVFPHPGELVVAQTKELPTRLQARLIELTSLGCKFTTGNGSWGVADLEGSSQEPADKWEHRDITLSAPSSAPTTIQRDIPNSLLVHFDGGCKSKKGSGGYVVWKPSGECVAAVHEYYGDARPTNNEAEA